MTYFLGRATEPNYDLFTKTEASKDKHTQVNNRPVSSVLENKMKSDRQ